MTKFWSFRYLIALGVVVAGINQPVAAEATPMLLMDSQLSVSLMMFVSSGYCLTYTYDANGNRFSQVAATFGSSGATWGSVSYGCFIWTP